jgi:hypothetical protein
MTTAQPVETFPKVFIPSFQETRETESPQAQGYSLSPAFAFPETPQPYFPRKGCCGNAETETYPVPRIPMGKIWRAS